MELTMNTREAGDVNIIDLEGELDTYSCPTLRDAVVRMVDEGKKKILLNMQGVEYIDSAGLGTLVGGLKRATENDGILKIVHANEQLQKVFNITGLVRVFEQYDDEQQAIQSFEGSNGSS